MIATALVTPRTNRQRDPLDFTLPHELEAGAPPEARGISRDHIRLMVSDIERDRFTHTRFARIGDFLDAGDVLVINTSGTMSAALDAAREDGTALELRLSTRLPGTGEWAVELRLRTPDGASEFRDGVADELIRLPCGATAKLIAPHGLTQTKSGVRLWQAGWTCRCRSTPTCASTAARSVTATCARSGPPARTRTSTPQRRAAPRCHPPAAASPRR